MAVLTADRNTMRQAGELGYAPIAASTRAYQGGLCLLNAAGAYSPASPLYCAGVVAPPSSDNDYDNSAGAAGDQKVAYYLEGCFPFDLDATYPPTTADIGRPVFAVDDYTLALSPFNDAGDEYPYVGVVERVEDSQCWVRLDPRRMPELAVLGEYGVAPVQSLAADGDLVINRYQHTYKVASASGAVTLTAALPDGKYLGQRIRLEGTHNTNVLTITTALNCKTQQGQSIALADDVYIDFQWDGSDWQETGRSPNA